MPIKKKSHPGYLFQHCDFFVFFWLQVLNSEEIDASDEHQEDHAVTSSGFSASGLDNQMMTSSTSTNSSFEVSQLKEINLQLYQHAVKKILQTGKRE